MRYGLRSGLVLPEGVETGTLLERVEPLIDHGVHGLLYHRRPSGAWGWRTYVDSDPSPSKTALCLLALSAVCAGTGPHGDPAYRDGPRETGGVHGAAQLKRLSEVVTEAGQWLLRNRHRWETFVEDDKDVQGTTWEHMAYALCARAVIRAGASPRDPRLAKAWALMNDLWDPEAGLWNEPGASGRRATIRAAYYTVAAYEEAVRRMARMSMEDIGSADAVQTLAEMVVEHVALGPGRTILASTRGGEERVACELSGRLFDLVKVVHDAPGRRLSTEQIAQTLYVAAVLGAQVRPAPQSGVLRWPWRRPRPVTAGYHGRGGQRLSPRRAVSRRLSIRRVRRPPGSSAGRTTPGSGPGRKS